LNTTYNVDKIVTHPGAAFNMAACASNQPNYCEKPDSNSNNGMESGNDNVDIITGHDLALIHFVVAPNQTAPSGYGATFRPVLTASPIRTRPTFLEPSTFRWI
jgi:hypothetical protein